jgi:hypothetical protein
LKNVNTKYFQPNEPVEKVDFKKALLLLASPVKTFGAS